jgi:hypothetical protein
MNAPINEATGEIGWWKTPYNHDTEKESDRTALTCNDPSKAQQHAKEECDINTIVDRFLKTGALPPIRVPPTYSDFAEVFDLQTALNQVKAAQDSFNALPAGVRARFQNDPTKFVGYVDHCMTTGDLDPLREMGLAVPAAPDSRPDAGQGTTPPNPQTAPTGPQSDTKS